MGQIKILSQLQKKLPLIIIISAFGPYILPTLGIRTDHIMVYSLFIIVIFLCINKNIFVIKNLFYLFLLWGSNLMFMFIRSLLGLNAGVAVPKIIAEFDSFLQPLIVLFLFMLFSNVASEKEAKYVILRSCKLLIILLSLNTIFSFISMIIDVSPISTFFWGSVDSVAARAATNGRYSGIFNQPMEAGVLYSLGLFSWNYVNENSAGITLKKILNLILIIIGGFLSVSKIFIFGGLILFIFEMLSGIKTRKTFLYLLGLFLIIGFPIITFLEKFWLGFNYLTRFFNSNQNFLELFTAGRFGGNDSQQSQLFSAVWNEHPVIGMGFGVNEIYDSGYFLFFGNGGLISLFGFIVILLYLVWQYIRYYFSFQNHPESKLLLVLIVLIIGGSFGAPVLTLNRVGIIVWVFISVLFRYFYFSQKQNETIVPNENS